MPKIVNAAYKKFLDPGQWIETIPPDAFIELLNKMQYKNKHRLMQAKGILLLLYWSGARPSEIMGLTPENFFKEGKHFGLRLITLKGGEARIVLIPRNAALDEFYEYAKRGIPKHPVFYKFAKKNFNRVSWKLNRKVLKETPNGLEETKIVQTKERLYDRNSSNAYYLCIKWLGIPPYFLRHNRFTRVIEAGGGLEAVKRMKGAKDSRSADAYIKYTKKLALKDAKFNK